MTVRIEGGRVAGAPFLEDAAAVTGEESIEEIALSRCSLEFDWQYPRAEVKQIEIEAEGVFHIQGGVVIDNQRLRKHWAESERGAHRRARGGRVLRHSDGTRG